MKNLVIKNSFGHEVMACGFAQAYGMSVVICPDKEDEAEYNREAARIHKVMSYFTDLTIVPFAERKIVRARDIVAELKAGELDDRAWMDFFATKLEPARQYDEPDLYDAGRILFVPEKLKSDGECGVTAQQQSLTPEIFSWLKDKHLYLGQHFHKVNDLEKVKNLQEMFPRMLVPGMEEYPELLGLRGVEHRLYHTMYESVSKCIGIAGTHTWILLTLFPEKPQVILYNKKGVENWQAIARAARRHGYDIIALGFDENTDMKKFSEQVRRAAKIF